MTDDEQWDAAAARHEEAVELARAGRLEAAEVAARDALARLQSILGPDHPDVGNALDTLAGILASRGLAIDALALWPLALAALTADDEVVLRMRAGVLRNFAYALVQAGDYAAASSLIDAAIATGVDAADAWSLRGV